MPLPIDSIIASSSSGITPSVMQTKCKHPERVLVGHPFNPPHIIPLVEVVGGTKTSPEAIQQAIAFYASIGKKPIHLKKELPGHVGNRLQAALYKEIMYLIQHDVLSVEDADVAVSYGPGPRWGVMGPSLQWHLGGGAGGIKHFMDHLMDPLAAMIKTLGTPDITPELKQTIVEGVLREAGKRSVDELAQEENELLIGLLRSRAQASNGDNERNNKTSSCISKSDRRGMNHTHEHSNNNCTDRWKRANQSDHRLTEALESETESSRNVTGLRSACRDK